MLGMKFFASYFSVFILMLSFQLHIIDLVSSGKFQHFQAVLDLYIKESFSATLAYQ
jgi:hypothetical protein